MVFKPKSTGRPFTYLVGLLVLLLTAAAGCSALTGPLDTGTGPTPTASAAPPTPTLEPMDTAPPASPAPSPTPTAVPTQPGQELLPAGPITPPPTDFQPQPPSPPDPGAEGHAEWVRGYVSLVTDLLNSGRTPQEVLSILNEWSSPNGGDESETAGWFEVTDLDGDQVGETLFSLPVPGRGCAPVGCPAYLVLFEVEDDLFRPRYLFQGNPPHAVQMEQPRLLQVEDLNADGLLEALLQQRYCGAHTCTTQLTVGCWDGRAWTDLAADPISQSYTELTVDDRDGDEAQELVMHGGTYGSAGAGLQRPHTLVFDWVDGAYRLVEDIPDPSDHPYYLMMDANTALQNGHWDRALDLAERALDNPDFSDTMFPVEEVDRRRILTYAAVEAMLVQAQRGELQAMEAALDRVRKFAFYQPNPYSEAAERLLAVYRDTGDVEAACTAVEEVITAQAGEAVFFQQYGYNTERLTADQVCPLDQPTEGESPEL